MEKPCAKCKRVQNVACFSRDPAQKCGLRPYCRECESARVRVYKARMLSADPECWRERRRIASHRHRVIQRYGMTEREYSERAIAQEYRCAICDLPERWAGRAGHPKQLAVDHDHDTGRVRDLICHACNVGLGAFYDDAELLERAAAYLQRHGGRVAISG